MLQATVSFFYCVQHEDVALVGDAGGWFFLVPKLDLCFTNFLSISNELGAIKRGHCTGHHKLMGNATGCKFSAPEVAQFKGAINQLIVIGSHIIAKALLIDFACLQA